MSDGVSVDANVMALFAKSFLPNKADTDVLEVKEVVGKIRSTVGFVIDSGGKIQHQWSATCGWKTGNPFREWFVQSLKDGKIRPVVALLPEENRKKLRVDYGFPSDQFEETYIGVANATATRYIMTGDMHFFEPKHRDADEKAKSRSRDTREGAVCRYLLNQMKIRVGTVAHAKQEL